MSRFGGWIALFVVLLLLQGCGADAALKPTQLVVHSELPRYQVGDTFIFSDSSVEKVAAVRGERVEWEARGGAFHYTTYRNFILPKLQWETETRRAVVQYSGAQDLLWPLQQGASEYFSTIVAVSEKPATSAKRYMQSWRCKVGGAYRIEVAAGSFDTQQVECDRTTLMGRWMQTRTWYYAPAVGHYVLQLDEYAPTNYRRHIKKRRELVALIPSDQHLTTTGAGSPEQHFQQSLETLQAGERSEWRDERDRHSREVVLNRTFRTTAGGYCREYQMKRRDDGRIQQYQGTACRDEDGYWRVAIARPDTTGDRR